MARRAIVPYEWSPIRPAGGIVLDTIRFERLDSMTDGHVDQDQFRRVIAYYLDCLAVEARRSLWLPISDEGSRFFQLKRSSEWTLSGERELSARLSGKNGPFASELQQGGVMSEVVYGYPILLQRNRKTGQMGVVPVFMQSVAHEIDNNRLTVWLNDELPHLNEEFVLASSGDSAEARKPLETALGFTEEGELPKDALSHFARNLARSTDLPQHEPIAPERIQGSSDFTTNHLSGLYNRHALVIAQRTNFTVGLEDELKWLVDDPHLSNIDATSLRSFFGGVPSGAPPGGTCGDSDQRVIEVVPLNEEQRSAVKSAFSNDLTVVTGPPGTGKSQIVTNIVANAWLRRESVLFASYNHKAVDVVEKRVRELSGRPAIIRTGRKSGNRDLRNDIFEFLEDFLSFSVDEHDRQEMVETRRTIDRLEIDRKKIWSRMEDLRCVWNRVDALDKAIGGCDERLRKLDDQIAEAESSRDRDRADLVRRISEIEAVIEKLKEDRVIALESRSQATSEIDRKIDNLRTTVDILGEHDSQVDFRDDRFDEIFRWDMEQLDDDLASLNRQSDLHRSARDEKVADLYRRRGQLTDEFRAPNWERQKHTDFVKLRMSILEVQSLVTAHRERFWLKILSRWRGSADIKKIVKFTERWANEFDVLGNPPPGQVVTEALDTWARYVAAALEKLSEWESDADRNRELIADIHCLDAEIEGVDKEFEDMGFDLRKAQLETASAERVEREIQSLRARIDNFRDEIRAITGEFESGNYEKEIADKHREIDRLTEHLECQHRTAIADLKRRRQEIQGDLNDRRSRYSEAMAQLTQMPKVNELASNLKAIETQLWETGQKHFESSMDVLPDWVDNETKRSIGDFGASLKRLMNDEVRGRSYWELKSDLERLFSTVISALPAWCVTNLSAKGGNLPLHAGFFDLVVIDEASQCNIPSALPLMYRAKRATIIGDPNQLQHITSIGVREEQQLQENHAMVSAKDQSFLFSQESLYSLGRRNVGDGLHSVREHFRSHSDIVGFSNNHWYSDRLRICTNYDELRIPNGYAAGIRWINVSGRIVRSSNGNINDAEAEEVTEQVVELVKKRGFLGSVGIVTPFRGQANLIGARLRARLDLSEMRRCDLVTDTVHGFQGDEKDVVFFSPCVGFDMPSGAERFLSGTGNLFNVAITRARALLFVVGNLEASLASDVAHIKGFAEYCNEIINPKDHADEPYGFKEGPNVGALEKLFFEALCDAGLKPMHQYAEGQYRLDFAFVTENTKLNVEVDGALYHREWDGSRSRNDLMRDHRLIGMGWQIKRFWVYELRDDIERCVDEVKELLL